MYAFFKKKIKPGWWKNPDFYITLSFLSSFLFLLLFLFAPQIVSFFRMKVIVIQIFAIVFLLGGALCSGAANWLTLGCELYPGWYMEEPTEEVLAELDAMLEKRRNELMEAKQKNEDNAV